MRPSVRPSVCLNVLYLIDDFQTLYDVISHEEIASFFKYDSVDFMIFNIDNFIYPKEKEDNCNNIIRLNDS